MKPNGGDGWLRLLEFKPNRTTIDVVDSEGQAETYHLVGAVESDPSAGRISIDSPVGRALVGKKKGDRITVSVPSGTLTLSVKAVK